MKPQAPRTHSATASPSELTVFTRGLTVHLMRLFVAGLLILILPAIALAQARGQVLSVGFNNHYRPDCWTPMLVQLQSEIEQSATYQIQVAQEDLDRDRVVFTQMVTLGGNTANKPATTENFWVYFRPKPTERGLPDATDLSTNLSTLNAKLKVFLCDKSGKQISVLPITSTIISSDPYREALDSHRGRKLVLVVSDGADKPIIPDYSQQKGVLEDVDAVPVQPRDLPSNIIGYEAVDAILWLDADANFLKGGTRAGALVALHDWVHQGGHLVICQPAEPFKIQPFWDILPVGATLNGEWTIPMEDRRDVDLLNQIAHPNLLGKPWPRLSSTFKVARVPALKESKVEEWIPWVDGGETTYSPYLARRGVGLGAVTWVAQNLGNPALTNTARSGWRFIWDRVFGWNNAVVEEDYRPSMNLALDTWMEGQWKDLGFPTVSDIDLTNTAAWYIGIACFFFVLYFAVAGPGSFFLLLSRKRAHLSWFAFALCAVVATGLTVLLVKAVVRGPPKMRHFSTIRYATGEPDEIIDSRFGLYIPQDGLQQIELKDSEPRQVSYITPFGIHPQYVGDEDASSAYLEYEIPVRDPSETAAVAVAIPYRSTSKKLEVRWVGKPKGQIEVAEGTTQVRLILPASNGGYINGTLVNHSGFDLQDIYLAFKGPDSFEAGSASVHDVNWLIYLPEWRKDGLLNIQEVIKPENLIQMDGEGKRRPRTGYPAYGKLERGLAWDLFWKKSPDEFNSIDCTLPMLTLFDQLPPWRAEPDINEMHSRRFELYRHNARNLDLSAALGAGQLVIAGTARVNSKPSDAPLPVPLTVGGDLVSGTGRTIVQYVLPLDRSMVYQAPASRRVTTGPSLNQTTNQQ